MDIYPLTEAYLPSFIEFCRRYRNQVDESYLSNDDLKNYTFDENITYIAIQDERIIGCCSLMMMPYYVRGKTCRFRIFHCIDEKVYQPLFNEITNAIHGINQVYLFLDEDHIELRNLFQRLGFQVERYSYLLSRNTENLYPSFPTGFQLKPFVFGQDEKKWCDIINRSFKLIKGHISDVTEEMVTKLKNQDGYLENGMMLLQYEDTFIGLVSIIEDEYEDEEVAYIGPIAVLPTYQGQGLGRKLLQIALTFAHQKGIKKAILTVNAENEKAIQLYLKEGFHKVHAVVSYCYNI